MKLLINDWKRAWRLLSVQAATALVALDVAGDHLPMIREYIGEDYARWAGILIIVARVIRQTPASVADDSRDGDGSRDVAGVAVERGAK